MKKRILAIIIILSMLSLMVFSYLIANQSNTTPSNINSTKTYKSNVEIDGIDYTTLNENILHAGPPKDGIPPIDAPVYISIEKADEFLVSYDPVFVYESTEGVFVYPQKILVWHEIVNDTIDGESVAITYCPLTGSTICYLNDATHVNNTFGTSGNLLNSNLVMYDRSTESYVPQILGIGINKALKEQVIQTRPIHWTTWASVKALYSDAKVLSMDTGFLRDYFSDPYGTYQPDDESSYYAVGVPFFPLLNDNDGTFQDKYVVIGVKSGDAVVAIDPVLVKKEKVINFILNGKEAVAFYDPDFDTVRVFDAQLDDQHYTYVYQKGEYIDQFGNTWTYKGKTQQVQLQPLTYFDVMWFAWHAYYPNTEVIK